MCGLRQPGEADEVVMGRRHAGTVAEPFSKVEDPDRCFETGCGRVVRGAGPEPVAVSETVVFGTKDLRPSPSSYSQVHKRLFMFHEKPDVSVSHSELSPSSAVH